MPERIDRSLAGTQFDDLLLTDVGASAFDLEDFKGHDWFFAENSDANDLELWTSTGKTGTQLSAGTDYTILSLNEDLTNKAAKNVYGQVQVTNATYQTGNLYASGYWVADDIRAIDTNYIGDIIEITADYIMPDADRNPTVICQATGSTTVEVTLCELSATNRGKRVTFINESSTASMYVDGNSTDTIGGATGFDLNGEGQNLMAVACDEWKVTAAHGTVRSYSADTDGSAATLSVLTWSNPTNHSLSLEAGVWDFYYKASLWVSDIGSGSVRGWATISTANNSESDPDFTSYFFSEADNIVVPVFGKNKIFVATTTTYYLNMQVNSSAGGPVDDVEFRGSDNRTLIRARRIG